MKAKLYDVVKGVTEGTFIPDNDDYQINTPQLSLQDGELLWNQDGSLERVNKAAIPEGVLAISKNSSIRTKWFFRQIMSWRASIQLKLNGGNTVLKVSSFVGQEIEDLDIPNLSIRGIEVPPDDLVTLLSFLVNNEVRLASSNIPSSMSKLTVAPVSQKQPPIKSTNQEPPKKVAPKFDLIKKIRSLDRVKLYEELYSPFCDFISKTLDRKIFRPGTTEKEDLLVSLGDELSPSLIKDGVDEYCQEDNKIIFIFNINSSFYPDSYLEYKFWLHLETGVVGIIGESVCSMKGVGYDQNKYRYYRDVSERARFGIPIFFKLKYSRFIKDVFGHQIKNV